MQSVREVKLKRKLLKGLAVYTEDQIWEAVVKRKEASGQDEDGFPDLREPEWKVFSDPDPSLNGRDFKLRVVEPPKAYRKVLEKVVLAERLREVRALTGFTRIESPGDYTEVGDFPKDQRVPLRAEGPEVGAHLRDPGRGGLPPVLRAGHRGVGREDGGAGGRVLRGPQAVAEEPGPGARRRASRRCGTCSCTRSPTP